MPGPIILSPRQRKPRALTDNAVKACPECEGPVAHESGCLSCRQCGWGRCG